MNIIFLSLSSAVANIENRGIYPDLLRAFLNNGHNIYIVCPNERKNKIWKTYLTEKAAVKTLHILTPNYTKTNIFEKALALLSINVLYWRSIKTHFNNIDFDLILYATPPITFTPTIKKLKKKNSAFTYLMLKDIFPQNAIDLDLFGEGGLIHRFYRRKEVELYKASDKIGCMSEANLKYLLKNNSFLSKDVVEVCPNALEIQRTGTANKEAIRKEFSLPPDKLIAVYGGNLGKPQGIDFLLEVLEKHAGDERIFFLIAGSGTEFGKIEQFLSNRKINNVKLVASLPRRSFDQVVQASDIGLVFLDKRFTIPNFPSRILTYMEYSLPILFATDIHTDVGRIAEKNNFGFWNHSGDLKGFSTSLSRLIASPSLRVEMGNNGLRFLKDHYLTDHSYHIIMNSYNNR